MFFFWHGRPSPQRVLLGCATAAIIWVIIYGVQGYSLGGPPRATTIHALFNCFRTVKVDFVIPMYKQLPDADC